MLRRVAHSSFGITITRITDTPTKTGDFKESQISNSTDPFSWTLDASGQITADM
jgi:hypothetical protein